MEPFGPLALRRMVKDDGRALLVYAGLGVGDIAADRGPAVAPVPGPKGAAVSELRHDALRDEQVVYAIHRQDRTFLPAREQCPLDPTHPGGPATEIPLPAFEIAVFDNRFPAFEPPHGGAEVVVYTDDHDAALATLPARRAEQLMWVWRHRYLELGARDDVEYVYIFENRGVEVGVTLHHPHGQIYAYPFLPPIPAKELAADARLRGCAVCALLAGELEQRERVVHESERVVAYVPYAARWAYEAHVVMRAHRTSLVECDEDEMRELAGALQALARGYDALFGRPFPYVMAVHQAPTRGLESDSGHLHIEFYPPLRTADKLKFLAGSEQGAGTFISDTLPEESARALARAIADAA